MVHNEEGAHGKGKAFPPPQLAKATLFGPAFGFVFTGAKNRREPEILPQSTRQATPSVPCFNIFRN